MRFDVNGPVKGRARDFHEHVRLSRPVAGQVRREPSTEDNPCTLLHGGHGGQLPFRPVVDVYCDGTCVEGTELGEDLRLERPATLDPAIGHWRCRQRLARTQDVPLRSDRATPGDVGALCHDRGDVVTGRHRS